MKFKLFTILLSFILVLSGCSTFQKTTSKGLVNSTTSFETQNKTVSDAVMSDDIAKSIKGSNQAGYNLIKDMSRNSPANNTLLSPTSLSFALAMVQNGANGETRNGIFTTMQDSDPGINSRFNALLNYFNQLASEEKKDSNDTSPNMTLNIANSFWFNDDIIPKQDFVNTLKASYDAEVYQTNFNDPKTVDQINQWVEEKTNHLLKNTLSQINPDTIAFLMNTVYFKGNWVKTFDASQTAQKPFYVRASETVNVNMMHQENSFEYFEDASAQIAGLPYYGGSTMYVLLPKQDLEIFINASSYDEIVSKIDGAKNNSSRLILDFPKFQYEASNQLKDPLSLSGMETAFSSENADFSNMIKTSAENVYISDLFQNTSITVDEKGTEAAAVTVVEMGVTSIPADEPKIFNCDRPFMLVIQENQTGAILFIGEVKHP